MKVTITETLCKEIEVECAKDNINANDISLILNDIKKRYYDEEFVLSESDFVSVDFDIIK